MSVYIPYGLIRKREVAVMDCCWRTSSLWEIIALVIYHREREGVYQEIHDIP
jgi:hypothetical protein